MLLAKQEDLSMLVDKPPIILIKSGGTKGLKLNLTYLKKALEEDRNGVISQFLYTTLVATLFHSYACLHSYCEDTEQLKTLKSQPWYHFYRLIRNCLAHNMRFCFGEYDRSILPIDWDGLRITAGMEGTAVTFEWLDPQKSVDLLAIAESFVLYDLT